MPGYRLYILNEHGHAASGADVICNDDDHAVRTFERHEHLYGAELWQKGRLVRAFRPSVAATPPGMRPLIPAYASQAMSAGIAAD